MSYCVVLKHDMVQDGWILIIVMTMICKCEDVNNLVYLKAEETLLNFRQRLKKITFIFMKVLWFILLSLLVKIQDITHLF